MKRKLCMATWLVALAAVVMTIGAGGAAAQERKLVFGVPGIPPVFASVLPLVAEKEGFFKKHGVNVQVRPFDSGAAASRAVLGGDIDMSLTPSGLVINQISNANADLTAIYGLENPDWLIASTDPSASCATIKGNAVGVDSVGGARSIALKQMLPGCKLTMESVQQVPMSSNVGAAMVAGQIKYGVLHVDDVPVIEEQTGKPLKIITNFKQAYPVDHYLLLIARRDRLAPNRDAFVRAIAGLIDAERFMRDPKNAAKVAQIAQPTGRSAAQAEKALKGYLAMEFWPHGHDGLTQKNIEAVIKAQQAVGNIKPGVTPAPFSRIADPSLWRDANAMVK